MQYAYFLVTPKGFGGNEFFPIAVRVAGDEELRYKPFH